MQKAFGWMEPGSTSPKHFVQCSTVPTSGGACLSIRARHRGHRISFRSETNYPIPHQPSTKGVSSTICHGSFGRCFEAGRGWNEILDCPRGPALDLRINLPSRRDVSVRRYLKLNVICMSLFGAPRVDILIASTHIILASDRCRLIAKQATQPLAASPDAQR